MKEELFLEFVKQYKVHCPDEYIKTIVLGGLGPLSTLKASS
jgi:hypothetical protein